jgi:hypothetical protein
MDGWTDGWVGGWMVFAVRNVKEVTRGLRKLHDFYSNVIIVKVI